MMAPVTGLISTGEAFAGFGTIKNVEMARECFFVEFEAVESARKAISLGTVKVNSADYKVDKRRPPRPHSGVSGSSVASSSGASAGSSAGTTTQNNNTNTTQRPRIHNRNSRPRQPQEGAEEKK